MKSKKPILLLLVIVSFSINANGQLWKEYLDSAKSFNDKKESDKAIEYYIRIKEELKKDSVETKSYARICNELGILYNDISQYEKAEPLFIEAKQIRENVLGKQDSDYATSCYNLGRLYRLTNQFKKAEPLYLEAKLIREKVCGKRYPDYATSCYSLGGLYRLMGEYKKAEILFLEAKQIREELFGRENPDYAATCNNLAILYMDIGQFGKAEFYYIETREIRKKKPGNHYLDYAESCNNLGALYLLMGKYEKAEPLIWEAKKLKNSAPGNKNPSYARTCDNLGILYTHLGQFEKAEQFFMEAKEVREEILPKDHPDQAASFNNLAGLYNDMGLYEKAELLFLKALEIREKVYSKNHILYASGCGNLGNVYKNLGEYEKAEPYYIEAKQITEKIRSKKDPYYATSCDNLAGLYYKMDQYEKAESLYLEAKAIREMVPGKSHPDYAKSCNNLAVLYMNTNQFGKAKPLYSEAKQIFQKTIGKEHPDYIAGCTNLANLYWRLNEFEKAYNSYREPFALEYNVVKKIFQFTSETEKQSFLKKNIDIEKYLLSFNYKVISHSKQGTAYNLSLSNRNLILSSSQQLRQAIYNTNDTSIRNKYNSWTNSKEHISFWHTKPIAERPVYVNELEEQANTLEKDLTRLSVDFRNQQVEKEPGWKIIQQSLKPNEAAIEFVDFGYYNGKRWTDSIYYIALILRKNKSEPELVRLFEKKQLDILLNSTENLTTDNRINALYTGNKSLYNLAWKPLEKYLTGISKIYFASAGNLFKISFAALPVNDKQMLSDKYQLVQLNTTATITDNKQSFLTAPDKIQLYGGVQYNADSAELKDAVKQYYTGNENTRSLPSDITRSGSWDYLPGTDKEVSQIESLGNQKKLSVCFSSGINATEESVKALNGNASASVLHIATHGFFFPDPKDDKRDSLKRMSEKGGKVFRQSDNPLFRSGLVFAGANNAWLGKPIEGIEDGILTAYEVSNMYLPNTKLVVLSACETALGDIQGSEGVYGLQRAFKMAGVQSLVMSLWRIGDRETAEFMQLFYKHLFDKQSVNDAFYHAQTIMKNKYRNEPFKWAAWVLVR